MAEDATWRRARELHVTAQFAVNATIDAHVHHDGAITDPVTGDVGGLADGRHHEIRTLHFGLQVFRACVAHRDR